jgi:flagellar basal body P-ring formation protein FlgA
MSLFSVALAFALATGPAVAPAAARLDDAARSAIVSAVQARLGDGAEVSIDVVGRIQPPTSAVHDAVLDPAAKLGVPSRVVFRGADPHDGPGLVPMGGATVVISVVADHVHAVRPIRRGQTVSPEDVAAARHGLVRGPLRRLPDQDDVVGGLAVRDLAAGACIVAAAVAAQPAVRPGDEITARVRLDHIEARTTVIAVDAGKPGARIRVMHPDSRRTFQARVVSRGLVEIQP